jgi:hypothetical protein
MSKSQHRRPDESWPLVQIRVPGDRTYRVRALAGPQEDGQPFDIKVSGGTAKITPGIVANLVPSGIFNAYSVGVGTTYFICSLHSDGSQFNSASISTSSSAPQPSGLVAGALPSELKFVFGIVSQGRAFRTIGSGNPKISATLVIETDKPEAPPIGVPGIDRWYNVFVT